MAQVGPDAAMAWTVRSDGAFNLTSALGAFLLSGGRTRYVNGPGSVAALLVPVYLVAYLRGYFAATAIPGVPALGEVLSIATAPGGPARDLACHSGRRRKTHGAFAENHLSRKEEFMVQSTTARDGRNTGCRSNAVSAPATTEARAWRRGFNREHYTGSRRCSRF